MKKFSDLSRTGQIRRLRTLADAALAEYDIGGYRVDFHSFDTNLLFRVLTANGDRYMLRIATPGWRTHRDLESEAMWLDALARDTTISAPRIVPARSGLQVLKIHVDGSDGDRSVSLMTWVSGRILGRYVNHANLRKMGMLFAELHQHGKEWKPPRGFTKRIFNNYVSRGEPDILLDPDQDDAYTGNQKAQIERLHQRVAAEYAALDPNDLRVIHCDLWHDNVKLHKGELCPFDFEDTVWGYRLHDIAMAMLDLLEDFGIDAYPDLLSAFRRGYESLLEWPEGNMETLQVGRLLWKLNGMARFGRPWLPKVVAKHEPIFNTFESNGTLPFRV